MKKFLLIVLCLLSFNISYARSDEENGQNEAADVVQQFKNAVKTDNPEIIADYVVYPFERRNPLPDIQNKEEFIKNYEMIFDDDLKQAVNDSEIEDWESVGWRGIMLYNGLLWIDENGKLIAVNYGTDKAREYVAKWLQKDKERIYEPLRKYDANVYIFKTTTKLGRIDRISPEGSRKSQYRLALWNRDGDMSGKPEVLIADGYVEYRGSANNTEYHFKSDEYEYVFFVNYVGPVDMPPYRFGIYEKAEDFYDAKSIVFEEADIVK